MGLDQYAFTCRTRPDTPVDFDPAEDDEQIFYWRKHANLQGWMERLYRDRGGVEPDFNCTPLVLTAGDLDRLEAAHPLPYASGFLWGESTEEDDAKTRDFIRKAREAISKGDTVYYVAWY